MSLIMEMDHSDGSIHIFFLGQISKVKIWLRDLILSQHGQSDIDEILIANGRACEQIHHDNGDTPSTDDKEKASWPWAGNILVLGRDN